MVLAGQGPRQARRRGARRAAPSADRVIVEGLNIAKKHLQAAAAASAGGHHREADAAARPANVHWSMHRAASKPTRIAHERVPTGADQKVRTRRVCKKCGKRHRREHKDARRRMSTAEPRRRRRQRPRMAGRAEAAPAGALRSTEVVPALQQRVQLRTTSCRCRGSHKVVVNIGLGEAIAERQGAGRRRRATSRRSPARSRS